MIKLVKKYLKLLDCLVYTFLEDLERNYKENHVALA